MKWNASSFINERQEDIDVVLEEDDEEEEEDEDDDAQICGTPPPVAALPSLRLDARYR